MVCCMATLPLPQAAAIQYIVLALMITNSLSLDDFDILCDYIKKYPDSIRRIRRAAHPLFMNTIHFQADSAKKLNRVYRGWDEERRESFLCNGFYWIRQTRGFRIADTHLFGLNYDPPRDGLWFYSNSPSTFINIVAGFKEGVPECMSMSLN